MIEEICRELLFSAINKIVKQRARKKHCNESIIFEKKLIILGLEIVLKTYIFYFYELCECIH